MNFFCRIFGHTWLPLTEAPDPRWNTTKDGVVLEATAEGAVRHFDECRRCRDRREVQAPIRESAVPQSEAL